MTIRARLAWAVLFAGLLVLAFPWRAGDLRLDVGIVAGWVALVPFARMLRGLGPRRAFAWALGASAVGWVGVLFWIWVVVQVHGHAPAVVAGAAVALLALAFALHTALVAAALAWLRPAAGWASFLVLPAAWVAAEHLRGSLVFGGFPWAYLGYSAHRNGPLLELASLGGVYGLSFLLAAFAALVEEGRLRAALILICVAHAAGFVRGALQPELNDPGALRAGIVQASIPQDLKWDAAHARMAFDAHLGLSRRAAAEGPLDLLLWPESSIPVFVEADPEYRREVEALARETGATLVIGGMGLEPGGAPGETRYFNSVFGITPEGRIVERYDKSRLVPFGEYVPWRRALGFLSGLATGLAGTDITPGAGPRTLRHLPPLRDEHAAAALICYEVIYPALVREAVRKGARVLLNLTNDAWYGRTSAPHQFLAIAALRSAEHGVPMLRAANTGVSARIDARGRVLEQTPLFERRALRVEVPPARPGPTPYTRLGDWVVWLAWAILIATGGKRVVRGATGEDPGEPREPRRASRADRGAAEASLTSRASAAG